MSIRQEVRKSRKLKALHTDRLHMVLRSIRMDANAQNQILESFTKWTAAHRKPRPSAQDAAMFFVTILCKDSSPVCSWKQLHALLMESGAIQPDIPVRNNAANGG